MILEGVAGIVEGLNPTLIRLKLEAYDREPVKPKKPKPVAAAPPAAAAKPGIAPRPPANPEAPRPVGTGAKT